MSKVTVTLAISAYDHVRDLVDGRVPVEGVDLAPQHYEVEEIFYRFTSFREWDACEMSMARFVALAARDDADITAIPVFPSRVFRQSCIYVRADSDLRAASDLAGKRVGIPEWAQTAGVYARGWLAHDVGLDLATIEWFQAGVDQPGRVEKVRAELPPGVTVTAVPTASLDEMLRDGRIDAAMTAHAPAAFMARSGEIVQLVRDWRTVEERYYRDTGIFPIMHVVALRRALLERHPWVAMNLLKAFTTAKARSMERALTSTASRFPFAWCHQAAEEARALFGDDFLPYGLEPNRTTLEAFLGFVHEQGLTARRVAPEELFPREVLSTFRV